MKKLLLLCLCATPLFATSQSRYYLIYDNTKSSVMGAELLCTAHFMFSTVEGQYLKPTLFKEEKWTGKALNVGYRLSKSFFIDKTMANFWRVFQHEVFGHGARAREYGYLESRYEIYFPQGGGATYYGPPPNDRVLSAEESVLRTIGGVESTMLLANTLRDKWLQSGQIPSSEAYLYYDSFIGISRYIKNTDEEEYSSGHDIHNYYRKMNINNGYLLEDSPLTIDYLKKRAWINYANPLRYYALWVLLKEYIWDGEESADLPMIPIGKYEYLPLFRMGLSPFGTEIYIENFLRTEKSISGLYARIGDTFFGQHWGGGISKTNIVNNNWLSLDTGLDFWRQPAMVLGGEELEEKEAGLGGAIRLGIAIKLSRGEHPLSLYSTLGYKTAGYLEGEYFRDGVFVRVGLRLLRLN